MAEEIPVLLDPALGVSPADLKAAWDADPDARQAGRLQERPAGRDFTGFAELVVIPIVTGALATLAADGIKEVIKKLMAAKVNAPVSVEKQTLADGKEAVVVQKK